jgi:protein pelota
MRIKNKIFDLVPGAAGKAELICDSVEDLWHLYNIIGRGDFIKTTTFRKVAHETGGGKTSSTKKKIFITIKVEEIEYDQQEGIIRFKGKNVSENEFISIGQYQAIEIGKGNFFTLFKKNWDEFHIERLRQATDPTITSDLAAIVMEEGVAHVYLISSHITTLKAKIEQSIPKKRKGASGHDKSLHSFFQKLLDAIAQHVNFDIVKCVIVASPGFTKDQFGDFLQDNLSNNKHYEIVQKNLNKFVYTHASNGYKQALQEVLSKPDILSQIKNTKANEDIVVMDRFNEILGKDMDRVIFGVKYIEEANEREAIDTLMVTDDYLRRISPTLRQKITGIMKSVKEKGGSVIKMSSQHVTGEKIDAFGGITGILRYAIPEFTQEQEAPEENFQDLHVTEEIEEDDKFAMLSLNDELPHGNASPKKGITSKMTEEDPDESLDANDQIDEQDEEEDESEDDNLGAGITANPHSATNTNSTEITTGNKNKKESNGSKAPKSKPGKLEQKERTINRKTQMRKKSNIEEEY